MFLSTAGRGFRNSLEQAVAVAVAGEYGREGGGRRAERGAGGQREGKPEVGMVSYSRTRGELGLGVTARS